MTNIHIQHKRRTAEQTPPSAAVPAAPVMIGNQSMETLMSGQAAPSAQNLGHRVDLPEVIRSKMENAFGADFGGVQLYESQAVADAGANAVTMGGRIAFAPGKLDFVSQGGQTLLGHELSHVASQARGEVGGAGFLSDRALETRADREGALAAAGESVYTGPVTPLSASSVINAAGPMQASKKDKKDRKQAAQILQGVVRGSDKFKETHGMNAELYADYTEGLAGFDEGTKNQQQVPYFDLSGDVTSVPYPEYQNRLEEDLYGTPNVDLGDLNGKMMLKNATHIERLAGDFKGVNLWAVNAAAHDEKDPSSMGKFATMDANSSTHEIRVNKKYYNKKSKPDRRLKRTNGKYGWNAINENYTGTHEMGHIVNYHLADKLKATAEAQNQNNTMNYEQVSQLVIAESLAQQAAVDPALHALLAEQLKLTREEQNGLFTGDPATIQRIAKGLDTPVIRDEIGDVATDYATGRWLREESPLLKSLNQAGYTSKYGSSKAVEMYAEAFGDHYRYQHKAEKYRERGQDDKLEQLAAERNGLSNTIVARSKELFDDEEKRRQFIARYAGPAQVSK